MFHFKPKFDGRLYKDLVRDVVRIVMLASAVTSTALWAAEATVDFNTDVRPIFNRYCTSCHGGVKQAGDVSLIYRERVLESGIVEPGDAQNSELLRRVLSDDPDERMPPPEKHPDPLSQEDIATLRDWINQGAPWGNHWSLEPPVAQQAPLDLTSSWPRRTLDHWVLERMTSAGHVPAVEAEPGEWLRRVYFDLIGLPPTVEQFQNFQAACGDHTSDRESVYEAVVSELLASQHFGERWAVMWMDLARYADSKGFEKDPHRDMWPYRDWLINAFNTDMPYDEFTIKQLAGDLLPDTDAENLIATAFHRNTQTNTEGGTDDEEFRVAAVIDRVNSTWTVWQATTFGCVQCHSHPYDPFRHEEYYSFMAFFNSTEDHDFDNDYPTLELPADFADVAAAQKSADLDREIRRLRTELNQLGEPIAESTADWQAVSTTDTHASHGVLTETPENEFRAGIGTYPQGTVFTVQATGRPITALRVRLLPENDDPKTWPETGMVLSNLKLSWRLPSGELQPIELCDVFADHLTGPYSPTDSLQSNAEGFGGYPKLERPRWAVFVVQNRAEPPDGATLAIRIQQDASTTGARSVHLRRFTLETSDSSAWTDLVSGEARLSLRAELTKLRQARDAMDGAKLPIMVEREADISRPTHLFIRGNWLDHGELVTAGTPGVLPPLKEPNPTRLDMAKWIVAPENPLTARVWVNRIWAELFGIGIVETLEDFGSTGTPPSHPQLLDHLALQMQQRHAWQLKPFLRDMVMSATYRQSSRVGPQVGKLDPRNQFLARGPRTRLTSEMVRDQALVAAGLLTERVGGPSVMPPQPDGIWKTVYNNQQWRTAEGPERYRRGLYTYWRRTSPYPSSVMFDAPSREFCSARRVATNTPLQALVTLNDPVFVECSAALASRAQQETGSFDEALTWMYQAVCQRDPTEQTRQQLKELHAIAHREFDEQVGDGQLENAQQTLGQDAHTFAMTIVASTLLNLDRAVTK